MATSRKDGAKRTGEAVSIGEEEKTREVVWIGESLWIGGVAWNERWS